MDIYEKKYKEALERTRKLKENPQSVFNEYSPKEGDTICDYIFPELKESEDEKIRKELIDFFQDWHKIKPSRLSVNVSDILAWLEKQGEESNDKNEPKFKVGDRITKSSKKSCPVHSSIDDTICEVAEVHDTCYILNTKEGRIQEPFEWQDYYELVEPAWSEEDEKIRKELIDYINRLTASPLYIDKYNAWISWLEKQGKQMSDPRYSILDKLIEADDIYQMSVNDAMVEEAKNKAIEALSKLEISKLLGLEKQGEQKLPIEKLPFEMKTIGESLGFATQEECDKYNQVVSDLIMCGDDKGEKKLAWSEDDEIGWTNTMIMIKEVASNHYTKDSIKLVINWLKSLKERCTWKPSDEQLNNLKQAINAFPYETDYLELLYDDLKKLKGE